MQELKSKFSVVTENERLTKTQLKAKTTKITEAQAKIKETNNIVKSMEDLDMTIKLLETEIDSFKDAIDEDGNQAHIDQLKLKFSELEQKSSKIQTELAMLNLQGGTRAKLSVKQGELDAKSKDLEQMTAKVASNSSALISGTFDEDTIDFKVTEKLAQLENNIRSMRSANQTKNSEVSGVNSKLSLIKNSLSQKSIELESKLKSIKQVCGDENYDAVKSRIESEAEGHRK